MQRLYPIRDIDEWFRLNEFLAPYVEGKGELELPPGSYNLHFVRGTEYQPVSKPVVVQAGKLHSFTVRLKRYINTENYLSVGLGLRTNRSWDGRLTTEQSVQAAVCEGLEFIISGDINTVTDYQPAIESLGLSRWVQSARGVRIQPESEGRFGEYMIFPLPDNIEVRSATS